MVSDVALPAYVHRTYVLRSGVCLLERWVELLFCCCSACLRRLLAKSVRFLHTRTLLCLAIHLPFSLSAQVFDTEPEDVLTAVGAAARFDCSFSTTSPASLSWLLDGDPLAADSRHTFHSNGSLEISPVETEDEGEYTCRVVDTLTMEVEERTASLTLASKKHLFLTELQSFFTTSISHCRFLPGES